MAGIGRGVPGAMRRLLTTPPPFFPLLRGITAESGRSGVFWFLTPILQETGPGLSVVLGTLFRLWLMIKGPQGLFPPLVRRGVTLLPPRACWGWTCWTSPCVRGGWRRLGLGGQGRGWVVRRRPGWPGEGLGGPEGLSRAVSRGTCTTQPASRRTGSEGLL